MPLVALVSLSSPIVSCSMINILIQLCLWPMVYVLNNILTLGVLRSAISHLPGCVCPWTFFQNIGLNMILSDPLMSRNFCMLGLGQVRGMMTHIGKCEEIRLKPKIWCHDAIYHEADHYRKWTHSMFAFSDLDRPMLLLFSEFLVVCFLK